MISVVIEVSPPTDLPTTFDSAYFVRLCPQVSGQRYTCRCAYIEVSMDRGENMTASNKEIYIQVDSMGDLYIYIFPKDSSKKTTCQPPQNKRNEARRGKSFSFPRSLK